MPKTSKSKEVISEPVVHNFEGLRDLLFDELNLLRSSKVSVSRARTVSQLSKRIIEAATLDLFARKMLGPDTKEQLKRLASDNVQAG